ncbi:MAG: hypothetical protein LUI87_03390 [Lachnospiraceae bacterium]|nr:hypothetical protein [Lachnospiraceae bacterium]
MNHISITNYSKYPNLVILLNGLAESEARIAFLQSEKISFSTLIPYIQQMKYRYQLFSQNASKEEIMGFNPTIIICEPERFVNWHHSLEASGLEKPPLLLTVESSDAISSVEGNSALIIRIYNVNSQDVTIVFSSEPQQCTDKLRNLNDLPTVKIQLA